jgi:hypothetical protein
LKEILTYNILDILDYAFNRQAIMDSYFAKLSMLLLKSDLLIGNLKNEMSLLDSNVKYCLAQKTISDNQYLAAFSDPYQEDLLSDYIESSKRFSNCASDARIDYNSKKMFLDKIIAYNSLAEVKYDYLLKYKDEIVENYDLIRKDILEHLIIIKNMLEKYDF